MDKRGLFSLISLVVVIALSFVACTPEATATFDPLTDKIDEYFAEDAAGWKPVNGESTWVVEDNYYQSSGLEGKFTSARSETRYDEITYIVRLKRGGSEEHSQGIYFFGNAYPTSPLGEWNSGITFDITNNGYFIIGMYSDGNWVALTEWTECPAITGWWNTLKVTSHGSTGFTQFYINNERVAYGTLTAYDSGLVGVGFYCESSSQLFVDYALVNKWAPYYDDQSKDTGGILIDEESPIDLGDWDRTQIP
jgi:hypothetical protein